MTSVAEVTIVTMVFESSRIDEVVALLARYVVLARGHEGCVNVDLAASVTSPGRFVVIGKWTSAAAAQAHLGSLEAQRLADELTPLLERAPQVDLLRGVSAHDLA